jgi:hypothetical protein
LGDLTGFFFVYCLTSRKRLFAKGENKERGMGEWQIRREKAAANENGTASTGRDSGVAAD